MAQEGSSRAYDLKDLADTLMATIQTGMTKAMEDVFERMERRGDTFNRSGNRRDRTPIEESEASNEEEPLV